MLRVMICDDEYIVLQGLQVMIDWPRYGMELVGTAANGVEALALFEAERPDIVFTDIRMPGMDGLQIVETILLAAPDTTCVVFSGFSEFEYVKKALKLGVADYLEKPITISMIEDTLQNITERIEERRRVSSIQSKWEKNRAALLEKVTLDLLLLGEEAEPKWREYLGEAADRVVGVTVIALSGGSPVLQQHSSYQALPIRNGQERLLVVFHFQEDKVDLWQQVLYWPEEYRIAIGSGRTYEQPAEAGRSYKEALQALRYGQFMEEHGWTKFEDIGENPNLPHNLSEREEAVIFYMRTGDKEGLMKQLASFIQRLESERLNPDVMEREILKLVYLGMEVVKELGKDICRTKLAGYLPHIEIRSMHTKEKMIGWLHSQMEMMMDWMLTVRQSAKHEAVEKACAYMREHYSKDLTLQEVAEYVGMNPTYFSLLFKEEMDQTYIKYLTKLRIEKAKELLQNGCRVGEVSEKVGYYSSRHFSELFKKYTGVKPAQYRDCF